MKIFSPSTKDFFPAEMQADYEATGTWPGDGIEVSEEVFNACVMARSLGKLISTDAEGNPVINEPPPLTVQDLSRAALALRDQKMAAAALEIAPLQDAVDLDLASAEERILWTAWKRYRVELSRVPQQPGYPQEVTWPSEPEGASSSTA